MRGGVRNTAPLPPLLQWVYPDHNRNWVFKWNMIFFVRNNRLAPSPPSQPHPHRASAPYQTSCQACAQPFKAAAGGGVLYLGEGRVLFLDDFFLGGGAFCSFWDQFLYVGVFCWFFFEGRGQHERKPLRVNQQRPFSGDLAQALPLPSPPCFVFPSLSLPLCPQAVALFVLQSFALPHLNCSPQ